ncbi:cbb3-type cytochrome c oxidase subunit I [Duganella violaceipulchra]|uniref:Cbb3-type cytochrome c oxidase subunit I n=1 Tax=Duganella violaceipulchra TaxID=2849652 RepID=A0AA41L8U1_9BURK|nr:cbb3-type cytochrome c oxidase subunit I [Duganella violaceicalia]MBV6325707.1 cbb3-type cytochrome c oxidase subunit I [Duganella violaceicalia]MCP2012829.1 cytochrome c oxidase cbb3-type subunit 1 [Duganella violaceicalia]
MDTVTILLSSFVLSITGLFVFIWSLRKRLFDTTAAAANVIFSKGEIGRGEEPSATAEQLAGLRLKVPGQTSPALSAAQEADLQRELQERVEADRSTAFVSFVFLSCAVVWLVAGSLAGLTSSIKLHEPDWLVQQAWLTFGRIRTIHLNIIAYGWAPMAAFGIANWLLPRLLKTPLIGGRFAILGCMIWNAGLIAGVGCIAAGISDGMEWLEIPWQVDILIVIGGALMGLPLVYTLQARKVDHLYVSVWYMGAALFWFPILFLIANLPAVHFGVEQATMNWWFGHNVLGLFYTPMALASVYYFLPKIIGRPVQSYNLSLLGFWTLAFFYGQVGGHHLIGGPVPAWLITLSIVQSMMMIIPVISFSINQHMTMRGYFSKLIYSPTLRFIVLGGMMYTLSSLQGSFEALRAVSTVAHFTHFTVAHAHLGLYGFFTMVMFGSIYFVMPRVMSWEWPYPSLIAAHFWLVVFGFSIYFIGLSIGGWLQGLAMLDAAKPFMESVKVTIPYLQSRSVGGAIMTLGHLVFAGHFVAMILRYGPARTGAALLHTSATKAATNEFAGAR